MLTPSFLLRQDDDFLHIQLKTPFIKTHEVEMDVEGNEFRFYANPYYLRLYLPGNIVEDGRETAKFDVDSGVMNISIPKETKGQVFADLDLLTNLLTPKTEPVKKPVVEVISSQDFDTPDTKETCVPPEFSSEQKLPEEGELNFSKPSYGFNNQYQGFASQIRELGNDVMEMDDVDAIPQPERRQLRLVQENLKFDEEHYIADLLDDETINVIISQTTPFKDWLEFSEEERRQMTLLPRKEYLEVSKSVYLGLVDIAFAFCYDHRTTEGDPTVESAWTICKLSSTLSCFEEFQTLDQVLTANLRRSLAYPLYRNWKLSLQVIKDVAQLFNLGKLALTKMLLQCKMILEPNEQTSIFSKLYLEDYCVWIQSEAAKDQVFGDIGQDLTQITFEPRQTGWELEELEREARQSVET